MTASPWYVQAETANRESYIFESPFVMQSPSNRRDREPASLVDRMIALLRDGKCQIETLAAITFRRTDVASCQVRASLPSDRPT